MMPVPSLPESLFAPLLAAPWMETLGLVLVHATWQGALVAAALWLALRAVPAAHARLRYGLALAALAALLALPALTWTLLRAAPPPPAAAVAAAPAPSAAPHADAASPAPPAAAPALRTEPAPPGTPPLLALLVLAWGAGVTVLLVRLAGGWVRTRRLVRRAPPAPEAWCRRLEALAERMGVRGRVALRLAPEALGPCVVGCVRPVVLMPLGVLTGLPAWQVEALLAHELAHVRRLDYLVNLLQSVAETALFFHPAAWWIARQVRTEREHCCDDLAAREHGAAAYARALADLAARRTATPGLALGAADGPLLRRVRRLVAPADAAGRAPLGATLVGVVLVAILLAACTDLVTQHAPEDARAPTPEQTALLEELAERRVQYSDMRAAHEAWIAEHGVTERLMPQHLIDELSLRSVEWRYLSTLQDVLRSAPPAAVLTAEDRAALADLREQLPNLEAGVPRMEQLIAERADEMAAKGYSDPQVTVLEGVEQRIALIRRVLRLAGEQPSAPSGAASPDPAAPPALRLELHRDGTLTVDGVPTALDALADHLRRHPPAPDVVVTLKVAPGAPMGAVADVQRVLRDAGTQRLRYGSNG